MGLAELSQNLGLHVFKPKACVDIKDSSQVRTKTLAPHFQRLREKTPCCLPKPTVPFHAVHETLLHDRPHSPHLRNTQEASSAPPLPSAPATPGQRYTGMAWASGRSPRSCHSPAVVIHPHGPSSSPAPTARALGSLRQCCEHTWFPFCPKYRNLFLFLPPFAPQEREPWTPTPCHFIHLCP